MTSPPGRLLCFEGIDGSGKTSLVHALRHALPDALVTRQPSDGPIGRLIRTLLVERKDDEIYDARMLAMLFTADRQDHYTRVLLPALAAGKIVILDRGLLSTLVYQTVDSWNGDSASPLQVLAASVKTWSAAFRPPDHTWVLDLPVDAALARLSAAGRDNEDVHTRASVLQRARDRYRELGAREDPILGPVSFLNATLSIPYLVHEVLRQEAEQGHAR